ncbi:type I-E CRISPR-associated protein Cas6/Cse3/CasE [Rhizohabitans arisaemae]|uniref:type I-E CRISPR-associated protein Cas6/Cse3/CasE n=1 Tax=Rhizohabitans arisaemae TaxID=2720610 RepID=UPI0024B15955|nr:type I-E CRISPR-associated protein Cas6/Cse3/CasE [Rhizohabitans arisaemae]
MTYLSRVRINPLRDKSRTLLKNPHVMHGAVLFGVPGDPTGQRILWRVDADTPHRPFLYVLTHTRPDWSHLIEQAGWPDADGEHAQVRDYSPLLAQIALGREFAFRLTANPIQNVPAPEKPTPAQKQRVNGGRRSLRIGHRTHAHQLNWFLTRTGKWGFTVPVSRTDPGIGGIDHGDAAEPAPDMRIIGRERRSFKKKRTDSHPVVLQTATFEGRLLITDVEAFTQRLLGGIGPAKSYGCGLLTLAPLPI